MTTGLFLLLRHFFPRCSFRFHKITLNLNNAPGKPGGMTSINQFSQFDCLKLKFYFFNGRMKKKKKNETTIFRFLWGETGLFDFLLVFMFEFIMFSNNFPKLIICLLRFASSLRPVSFAPRLNVHISKISHERQMEYLWLTTPDKTENRNFRERERERDTHMGISMESVESRTPQRLTRQSSQ